MLERWRQRIGEAGCEWLLAQSIAAATKGRVIKRSSLDAVVLDATVQPKAIANPTDSCTSSTASTSATKNWSCTLPTLSVPVQSHGVATQASARSVNSCLTSPPSITFSYTSSTNWCRVRSQASRNSSAMRFSLSTVKV